MALSAPGQTHGVSLFIDPLIADLDISRTQISTAYLTGTLIGACAMPAVGKAIDRYGPRWVMAAIGAVFGAILVALSLVTGVVGLTAGFVGIRMAGQGALTLLATGAVIDRLSPKTVLVASMAVLAAATVTARYPATLLTLAAIPVAAVCAVVVARPPGRTPGSRATPEPDPTTWRADRRRVGGSDARTGERNAPAYLSRRTGGRHRGTTRRRPVRHRGPHRQR